MTSLVEGTWISRFCAQGPNEYFCEVDRAYLLNDLNVSIFSHQVPYYEIALSLILDIPIESGRNTNEHEVFQISAKILYGLVHARYILTQRGMEKMKLKHLNGSFESCPRLFCESQKMLPIGLSDIPGEVMVKLYCPKCLDAYTPKSARYQRTDGAYFGTKFPHMFLIKYPELRPNRLTAHLMVNSYGDLPLAFSLNDENFIRYRRSFNLI